MMKRAVVEAILGITLIVVCAVAVPLQRRWAAQIRWAPVENKTVTSATDFGSGPFRVDVEYAYVAEIGDDLPQKPSDEANVVDLLHELSDHSKFLVRYELHRQGKLIRQETDAPTCYEEQGMIWCEVDIFDAEPGIEYEIKAHVIRDVTGFVGGKTILRVRAHNEFGEAQAATDLLIFLLALLGVGAGIVLLVLAALNWHQSREGVSA